MNEISLESESEFAQSCPALCDPMDYSLSGSSLSCIGEGNGNPLQCSCLEIPGMGEPGGLPSMGSHRVGHDGSDLAVHKLSKFSLNI